MNRTYRDLLILVVITGGLFAVIYGWFAYGGEAQPEPESEEESLFSEKVKDRLAASIEEQFSFVENEYTRAFESALENRLAAYLDDSSDFKAVKLIDDARINAFTTIGDRIYLFSGLVTRVDDPYLVTAVVAHELGHIHYNHVEERLKLDIGTSLISSIMTGGNQGMIMELGRTMIGLRYSRTQEEEADEFARSLLEKANIHPQRLSQGFLRLKSLSTGSKPLEFLSTHPSLDERIEETLEYQVGESFSERPLDLSWQDLVSSLDGE